MPQIEIMQSDLPHTLFKKNNKKENNRTETDNEEDEAERLTMESIEKAKRRREAEETEKSYTIDEIFNGKADE